MHFVFATRGIKKEVDTFVTFMQAQMFPWKRKNLKTGKDDLMLVQGALRPIQLWEYIIPEESKDELLTALNVGEKGEIHPFTAKLNRYGLRKSLGLKKVRYKRIPTGRYIYREGVALYPIGIKKDKRGKWKDEFEQEML